MAGFRAPAAEAVPADEYTLVAGLMDLRTDTSDGAHSLENIVRLAKSRGFHVLFINDHDRIALEYGLPLFRNILKKRVEKASLGTKGPENYLNRIRRTAQNNPGTILIPGSESAPFHYWRGSYFTKNLTVCDWEKHLLTVGLETPEDYKGLPVMDNGRSVKNIRALCSFSFFLAFIPLAVGLVLIFKKNKIGKISGVLILVLGLLFAANHLFIQSSPYDPYHGPQGIAPYQLLIDYVTSRGGMIFWNHPETKSGKGELETIRRDTPPYPQVLLESKNYTGFAALYGDSITVTEPGNLWDRVLMEYCQGKRDKPVWGISSADFHRDGQNGEKLGNYPTFFLVKETTKRAILEALKSGRMYAYRGDIDQPRLILEDFSISDPETSEKGVMGEKVTLRSSPRLHLKIILSGEKEKASLKVRLIRFGELARTFEGRTPLTIDFKDEFYEPGKMIFYRLDVRDERSRAIVANPIFVQFLPPSPK